DERRPGDPYLERRAQPADARDQRGPGVREAASLDHLRQGPVDQLGVPDARRRFGDLGELAAARELERHGVAIVARNARTRYGELDLVGRDGRGYVFVEVKTRRRSSFVSPAEAVDRRKLARLRSLALAWAGEHQARGRIRMVVAAVTVDREGTAVDL